MLFPFKSIAFFRGHPVYKTYTDFAALTLHMYNIYIEHEAVFNYRLSRARRIIENAFGILAARWRIFRRPIIAEPERVEVFAKAAIALHNYLRTTESSQYIPPGFVDGEDGAGNIVEGSWREEEEPTGLIPLSHVGSNRFEILIITDV